MIVVYPEIIQSYVNLPSSLLGYTKFEKQVLALNGGKVSALSNVNDFGYRNLFFVVLIGSEFISGSARDFAVLCQDSIREEKGKALYQAFKPLFPVLYNALRV